LVVAQFNVLADGLSGMDVNKGGFCMSSPVCLAWEHRRQKLVDEIMRHGVQPDIVALQEVDHFHDWFEPVLGRMGYDGIFLPKPDSPCRRSMDPSLQDGCALFWRRETVKLKESEMVNYEVLGHDKNPMKTNQVAILAEFEQEGVTPFWFAVTHLHAKKSEEGEKVRCQQIQQLLDRLLSKRSPCLLAMDMNAAPKSNGLASYPALAYEAARKHPLGLSSAYEEVMGEEPPFTTWKLRGEVEAKHTIDYIFMTGELEATRVLELPDEGEVGPERLPSWSYPSDHFALLAEIRRRR